jgi:hypothetical protein
MRSSLVPRISTGRINTVNDAVDGDAVAIPFLGGSRFPGQLGKIFSFDDYNVIYDPTVGGGTVYGGDFQYVTLAAGAGAIFPGAILFWDTPNIASNIYQVTTVETPAGTDAAVQIAGICLNAVWTPGNNAFIQLFGLTYVKFRAALTNAGAIGGPAYAAGAGGADIDKADVVEAGGVATGDLRRFLGTQFDAATNGGLKRVFLQFTRLRG